MKRMRKQLALVLFLLWMGQSFGQDIALKDISVSSDGQFYAIDQEGKPYLYDWDNEAFAAIQQPVKEVPTPDEPYATLKMIRVGNKDNVWAVDEDKNIWQWSEDAWLVREKGIGEYIAVGVDGTVVALNEDGEAYKWSQDGWDELEGPSFKSVAVGSVDHIRGFDEAGNVWQFMGEEWQPVNDKEGNQAKGFVEGGINAAGASVFITPGGDIYMNEPAGVAVTKVAAKPGKKAKVKAKKVKAKKKSRKQLRKEGKLKKVKKKKGKKRKKKAKKKGKKLKKAGKKAKGAKKKLKKKGKKKKRKKRKK